MPVTAITFDDWNTAGAPHSACGEPLETTRVAIYSSTAPGTVGTLRSLAAAIHAVRSRNFRGFIMFRSRLAHAAQAVAAGLVAVPIVVSVAAAPQARAWIDDFTVSIGKTGASYGTNCSYTVTITGTSLTTVTLADDLGGVFTPPSVELADGTGSVLWTPTTVGTHTLTATDGFFDPLRKTIAVGHGINTGYSCIVN